MELRTFNSMFFEPLNSLSSVLTLSFSGFLLGAIFLLGLEASCYISSTPRLYLLILIFLSELLVLPVVFYIFLQVAGYLFSRDSVTGSTRSSSARLAEETESLSTSLM